MYKSYSLGLHDHRPASGQKKSTPIKPLVKKTNKELRLTARQRFFENVSVSGLVEFHHSPNSVIRWMWILALIASVGSITYHTILLIQLYLNRSSTYEFLQIDKEIIPFPKVTVCAPTGINSTWVYQHLSLPLRERQLLAKLPDKKKEEFLEAAASLIGHSFGYIVDHGLKPTDKHYFAYHHVVAQTYNDMDYLKEIKDGDSFASCEETVSNCRLDDTYFDCCNNSIRIISDEGPCYDLQVDKIDQLLNHPRSNMTPISFTFNLQMNWNHILDYSTVNGFSVHISDPYSMLGRPIAVPSATHAMIDLSQPTLRKDSSACFNEKMPDTSLGTYDASGYNCKMQRHVEDLLMRFIGCVYEYSSYYPEGDRLCTGSQALPLKMMMANGESEKVEGAFQEALFDIIHSKTRCLPLCTAWEYTPRPSYSELMRDDYTTPVGRNNTGNIAMSRVSIFIGSTFYMQRTEEQLKTSYNTFVQITFVFALYLGCSVISVAEFVYYGCELCLVYKNTRSKKNKVGPFLN